MTAQETNSTGHCIWYGVCHIEPVTNHKKYCPYDGPAKKLDSKGLEALSKWCGHLIEDDGALTCCDVDMVSLFAYYK